MDDYIFKIILALIPVIGAVITGLLIPWIRSQIGAEKLEEYVQWAEKAVRCAQQIYTPDQWQEKKNYCIDFLRMVTKDALTYEQIEVLIESAVKELKLAEKAVEVK